MNMEAVKRNQMVLQDSYDHSIMRKQRQDLLSSYGMRKMSVDTFVQKQSSAQKYKASNNCNILGFSIKHEEEMQGKTLSPSHQKLEGDENYRATGKHVQLRKQKIQVISSPRSPVTKHPVELKSPKRKGIERCTQAGQSKFIPQVHQEQAIYQQKPQSFHQPSHLEASMQQDSNNYFQSSKCTQSVQFSTNLANRPQLFLKEQSRSQHQPQGLISNRQSPEIHPNNYHGQASPIIYNVPMKAPPQNHQFMQNSSPNLQKVFSPQAPQIMRKPDPQNALKLQTQAPQDSSQRLKKHLFNEMTQSIQFGQKNTQEQPNHNCREESPNKQKSDYFTQKTQASIICPTNNSIIAQTSSSFFKNKQGEKSTEKLERLHSLQNRVKVSKSIFVPDEVAYTSFGQQYRFGSDGAKKEMRDTKRELTIKDSMQRSGIAKNQKKNTFQNTKMSVSRMLGDP